MKNKSRQSRLANRENCFPLLQAPWWLHHNCQNPFADSSALWSNRNPAADGTSAVQAESSQKQDKSSVCVAVQLSLWHRGRPVHIHRLRRETSYSTSRNLGTYNISRKDSDSYILYDIQYVCFFYYLFYRCDFLPPPHPVPGCLCQSSAAGTGWDSFGRSLRGQTLWCNCWRSIKELFCLTAGFR